MSKLPLIGTSGVGKIYGYTSMILFKNGKLSDVFGELQSLVKGLEKKGDSAEGDSDHSDAIAAQVRRLAMEVRQLSSSRQITVLNGGSGQIGNMTSLIVPAAAVGAMGYGYMWWKGLSFSDLMYVTKSNMANAVLNLTKQLDHVSELIAVSEVRGDLSTIGLDLDGIHQVLSGLDGKMCMLEQKQDFTTLGVLHLCNFVDGRSTKMPDVLQEQLKLYGNARGSLPSSEMPSLKGLKEIADSLVSENGNWLITDGTNQDCDDNFVKPRSLLRAASIKC